MLVIPVNVTRKSPYRAIEMIVEKQLATLHDTHDRLTPKVFLKEPRAGTRQFWFDTAESQLAGHPATPAVLAINSRQVEPTTARSLSCLMIPERWTVATCLSAIQASVCRRSQHAVARDLRLVDKTKP